MNIYLLSGILIASNSVSLLDSCVLRAAQEVMPPLGRIGVADNVASPIPIDNFEFSVLLNSFFGCSEDSVQQQDDPGDDDRNPDRQH
jgi:hypothetical protein